MNCIPQEGHYPLAQQESGMQVIVIHSVRSHMQDSILDDSEFGNSRSDIITTHQGTTSLQVEVLGTVHIFRSKDQETKDQ